MTHVFKQQDLNFVFLKLWVTSATHNPVNISTTLAHCTNFIQMLCLQPKVGEN